VSQSDTSPVTPVTQWEKLGEGYYYGTGFGQNALEFTYTAREFDKGIRSGDGILIS